MSGNNNYWRKSNRHRKLVNEQSYSARDGIMGLIPEIHSKPLFILIIIIGIIVIGAILWGIVMAVLHGVMGTTGVQEQDLNPKEYLKEFENALQFFKF